MEKDKIYDEDKTYYLADVIFRVSRLSMPASHGLGRIDEASAQVEDQLFKVPRHYFEEDSEIFRTMFQLPVPQGEIPDGSSKDKPLYLQGIAKDEFRQLLKVMYPRNFGKAVSCDACQWTSVLKLSTMWEFGTIRKLAIEKLYENNSIDHVDKFIIATNYNLREWLIPCVNNLARRKEPMGEHEVERLGWEYVTKIASVRESYGYTGSCRHCGKHNSHGGKREDHESCSSCGLPQGTLLVIYHMCYGPPCQATVNNKLSVNEWRSSIVMVRQLSPYCRRHY